MWPIFTELNDLQTGRLAKQTLNLIQKRLPLKL